MRKYSSSIRVSMRQTVSKLRCPPPSPIGHLHRLARREFIVQEDSIGFPAGKLKRAYPLSRPELQREHAHADQI